MLSFLSTTKYFLSLQKSFLHYPHQYLSHFISYKSKANTKPKSAKLIRFSKGQLECKHSLAILLPNYTFSTVRPPFLRNPKTNRPLELDFYCPELKLAVEYNGAQHYHFTPYIHSSLEVFDAQCYRDQLKKDLCLKNNITLIIVPYTIPNIHIYLFEQLTIHGFLSPSSPLPPSISYHSSSSSSPSSHLSPSSSFCVIL